jgi:hypothetical protein
MLPVTMFYAIDAAGELHAFATLAERDPFQRQNAKRRPRIQPGRRL